MEYPTDAYQPNKPRLFDAPDLLAEEDLTTLLDHSQEARHERLTSELAAIADQLEQRTAIHRTLVDQLTWKQERYTAKLERLYAQGTGTTGGREQMKERIREIEAALRDEYRMHWRDRQELEAVRREIRRELAALEETPWSEFL